MSSANSIFLVILAIAGIFASIVVVAIILVSIAYWLDGFKSEEQRIKEIFK